MKLKKIASLMLAGVMAVSMLAGCSNGGNTEKPVEPATGVNATTVIAALSKDTTKKVTFNASATLQATADKAASYVNDGVVDKFDLTLLNKIDDKLVQRYLPQVDVSNGSAADDMKTQTATFVSEVELFGANDSAIVNELAKAVNNEIVAINTLNCANLPTESKEYTDNNTSEAYKFTFAYTADMAVTSTSNENGQTTYYVVFTITRTPTRVAVEA